MELLFNIAETYTGCEKTHSCRKHFLKKKAGALNNRQLHAIFFFFLILKQPCAARFKPTEDESLQEPSEKREREREREALRPWD